MKNEEDLKKLFNNFTQTRRELDSAKSSLRQAKDALERQEAQLSGTTERYIIAKQALDEALQEEQEENASSARSKENALS